MSKESGEQMGGCWHGKQGRWVCAWVCVGGVHRPLMEMWPAQGYTGGGSSRLGWAEPVPCLLLVSFSYWLLAFVFVFPL